MIIRFGSGFGSAFGLPTNERTNGRTEKHSHYQRNLTLSYARERQHP